MSLPEAAQLVIQAASLKSNGDVFILDMGQPIKIVSLAETLIRQYGYIPTYNKPKERNQIQIIFSGIRPGEKLFEELLIGEDSTETIHPKIFKATEKSFSTEQIDMIFNKINNFIFENNESEIIKILNIYIEGYQKS